VRGNLSNRVVEGTVKFDGERVGWDLEGGETGVLQVCGGSSEEQGGKSPSI
jgi:hypothetical protein